MELQMRAGILSRFAWEHLVALFHARPSEKSTILLPRHRHVAKGPEVGSIRCEDQGTLFAWALGVGYPWERLLRDLHTRRHRCTLSRYGYGTRPAAASINTPWPKGTSQRLMSQAGRPWLWRLRCGSRYVSQRGGRTPAVPLCQMPLSLTHTLHVSFFHAVRAVRRRRRQDGSPEHGSALYTRSSSADALGARAITGARSAPIRAPTLAVFARRSGLLLEPGRPDVVTEGLLACAVCATRRLFATKGTAKARLDGD
jgi:hypothetical protein